MPVIHTILGAVPPSRADDVPWDRARIEEAALAAGPWATATTIALAPLDVDPAEPGDRDFTFASALAVGYFRIVWLDADDNESVPTASVYDDGEGAASPAGAYTSVALLKNFTALQALKDADDEWLAAAIIPVAEAMLVQYGPFISEDCPQLALAANMIAEALFQTSNPSQINTIITKPFRSESLGRYSYTINDLAIDQARFDVLLARAEIVVSACQADEATEVSAGSQSVIMPVPGNVIVDGELVQLFTPEREGDFVSEREVWR